MRYYFNLEEPRQSVLSKLDAYEVLRSLSDVDETLPVQRFNPMRLMTDDLDYYWVVSDSHGLYAVKIGHRCEVFHSPHNSSGLHKVQDGIIKIPLKDCSIETGENTNLYVECEYCSADRVFKVHGLYLSGSKIVDFPHSYWKAECLRADGTVDDGCSGDLQWWYRLADGTTTSSYHQDAVGRCVVWNGIKCIREYRTDDAPTISGMLKTWRYVINTYGAEKKRGWI